MSVPVFEMGEAPLDIIDGDRGKNYPKQNELLDDGHCVFLSATNVTKDGFVFDSCQFITESKDNSLRKGKVHRGDVILTTRGTLGNVAFYSDDVPFEHVRINSGMVTIQSDVAKLRPRYLYYFLKSASFQSQVRALQSGAAQPQLPIRDIKKIKIPLHDVTFQDELAQFIGTYDDLIENNRRRIALLEDAARLLHREWFVHQRFPGHEHTKIIDGVPEGWEIKPISALSSFISRGITPTYDEEASGVVINQKCIRQMKLNLDPARKQSKKVPEQKLVRPGDVLVNSTGAGTLGRVCQCHLHMEDLTVDSHVTIIRHADGILPHWFGLSVIMKEKYIETLGRGATNQTELSKDDLGRVDILVPTGNLMAEFEEIISPLVQQINALSSQIAQLECARDLLLPRLMDGRIEV